MSGLRMTLRLAARRSATVAFVRPSSARQLASGATATKAPLVLTSDKNGVRTLTMNDPAKLNGWTKPMMVALFDAFKAAATDPEVLNRLPFDLCPPYTNVDAGSYHRGAYS